MKREVFTTRCTVVESFRQFMYSQTEKNESYINEANVIASIKGVSTSGVKADYGTAGHTIIESPHKNKTESGYMVGDFSFTTQQAKPILKYVAEHPLMIREIPASKLYKLPKFDLIITGTIDGLEGMFMRDNKFKFSDFDPANYLESMQHRIYLDMLGMKHFFYDFFRVKGFESISDCGKAVIGECESMHVTAYPGMRDDIMSILYEFADFIEHRHLQEAISINPAKYARIVRGNPALRSEINNLIH
jgi:hypothetical protein